MSNVYLVEITADIPYPWPRRYREEATGEGPAVSRALRQYRKDVRDRNGRAKKITEFLIKIIRTGKSEQSEDHDNGNQQKQAPEGALSSR